ncbi:MAG: hypothetical protein NZM33_16785 [Bryobacteraceae bacterium]|nr:hypothetical protein [Bryobacteraceae bacterium]
MENPDRPSLGPAVAAVPRRSLSRAAAAKLEAAAVELSGARAFGLLAATLAVGEVGRALLLADATAALPAAVVGFGAVAAARVVWHRRLSAPLAHGPGGDSVSAQVGQLLAGRRDWLARFARHWEPPRDRSDAAAQPVRLGPVAVPPD